MFRISLLGCLFCCFSFLAGCSLTDANNTISGEKQFPYKLQIDETNTVYRTLKPLDSEDDIMWVVTHNGSHLLSRNAKYDTGYQYYYAYDGTYTIDLENSNKKPISNKVTYQVDKEHPHKILGSPPGRSYDASNLYQIYIDNDYVVHREGFTVDNRTDSPHFKLAWIVECNGRVVLERNARQELTYKYYNHEKGRRYKIYLEDWVNGRKYKVSNTVEYTYIPGD